MGDGTVAPRRDDDAGGGLAEADRPAVSMGLADSAPPDGLTTASSRQPERPAEHQLLVGERRVQLGHRSTGASATPAFAAAVRVDGDVGEVAQARGHGVDAVVDAA